MLLGAQEGLFGWICLMLLLLPSVFVILFSSQTLRYLVRSVQVEFLVILVQEFPFTQQTASHHWRVVMCKLKLKILWVLLYTFVFVELCDYISNTSLPLCQSIFTTHFIVVPLEQFSDCVCGHSAFIVRRMLVTCCRFYMPHGLEVDDKLLWLVVVFTCPMVWTLMSMTVSG